MARTLDIEPIDATFGAVVRGIKVAEADEATFRALYDAWLEYALLIFPDQHLARDQQIAFAKRFGTPLARPKKTTNLTQTLIEDRGL